MAGIQEAKELVKNNKITGKVLYKGEFINDNTLFKFILIELDNDQGIITQFDYNSDVKFEEGIVLGCYVKLNIKDDYTAIWEIEIK
jgi:hypothetical protein